VDWDSLDVDDVLANSYKDFHAKGMDYICLKRTPALTLKAYFFAEGMESQKLGEVVNPHDHRYDFVTQCYSGVIENRWYGNVFDWAADVELFNVFEYDTPLNGGSGFTQRGELWALERYRTDQFHPGETYQMRAAEFHTIRVAAPETVIVLAQYEDVVPVGQPTLTFVPTGQGRKSLEPPSLKGLYSEFKADEVVNRLGILRELDRKLL
jgi:hypothetical protein